MQVKDPLNVWTQMYIDLEDPDLLAKELPDNYRKYFKADEDRPEMMKYFDAIMAEFGASLLQRMMDFRIKGGKVVGTYCAHIPNDLIYAAGALPIGLCSASTTFAQMGEQFMPVNTCPLVKASLGARLTHSCPYAASADLLIGETSCDAKTKAWPIMQEEADVFVLQLPNRKTAEDFAKFKAELYKMIEALEELTGNQITAESLGEAIHYLNEQKKAIHRMWSYRKRDEIPISGKDCLIVQQCAAYVTPLQYIDLVNRLCDELDQRIAQGRTLTTKDTPRIMLSGSPIGLQAWHINSIIEACGGMVVAEETCGSLRLYERLVAEEGASLDEMLDAITAKYFGGIHCACFTPNPGRIEDLRRLRQDYKVDGLIDIHLKFCQIFDVEHYFIEKEMTKDGLPCIGLEVDYGDDASGQLLTRLEAFLEMIA
ncbi:double-cubane-cluster-containing anaerobic reductase [Facklamia hominis]